MDEEVERLLDILSETVGKLSKCVNTANQFVMVDDVSMKINELELMIHKARKAFEQEIPDE